MNLSAQKDYAGSAALFEKVLYRAPDCTEAVEGLRDALRQANVDGKATWRRLTEARPDAAFFWFQLAGLCNNSGETGEAIACLERVVTLRPENALAWHALGTTYAAGLDLERASYCLERAIAISPQEPSISLLGWVKNEQGDVNVALSILNPVNSHSRPSFARHLSYALLLPQIYQSTDDLKRWRARYLNGLGAMSAEPLRYFHSSEDVFSLKQTNFLLAYQGEDDLLPQQQYARLLTQLIGRTRPDLLAPVSKSKSSRKIKVAFVSSYFRECTIGHYFHAWVAALDPGRFESTVIFTGTHADATTRAIGAQATRFLVRDGGALSIAVAVKEIAPDILIYPEIGMHSSDYLLATMRLAPIQCAAWGHPVTTGSEQIDYFFTCGEMEPDSSENHYAEKLLRLPGLGTCYRKPKTGNALSASITRDTFGLGSNQRLYICPQSLFKVHPDNDRIFLDILAADELAVIVFFQGQTQKITQSFAERLARGMAARGLVPRKQVKYLPRLSPDAFRSVLAIADVVLDTLHWSGGNTSLDALSVGTPVVTLPGAFMRGRQSQAMLKSLDASQLIARDVESYVATALGVASDKSLNQFLKQRILNNSGCLFDRAEPLSSFTQHLERIYDAH